MQASPYRTSMFRPLRHARFRRLWLANLLSNLGGWVQAFAATWQIATLSESLMLTSLLQTVTWAPLLLCALPAGMLADAMHRPKLLFRSNAGMGLTAGMMALLTLAGWQSVPLVLLLTFVMGAGAAFTLPAWQASMSALAEPEEVAAVATLNNLSFNLAALAGPCLGGLLFHFAGAAPLYLFNALSFCALLWLYHQWQIQESDQVRPRPRPSRDLKAGLAASWRLVRYRQLLLHSAAIFCASTAFAALLPLLVRDVLRARGSTFGVLMGALGAGAVLAPVVLPTLRQHISRRVLLAGALLLYSAMLGMVGQAQAFVTRLLWIVCGGIAWSAIVTTLNSAALSEFPSGLRARTLSVYIFMIAVGQTAGGGLWGLLAARFGVVAALVSACVLMLACASAILLSTNFLEDQ